MSSTWLPIIKDIVVAGSAFGAAFIAYRGLSTWQRELKGKSEYQLAKDVLRSVYKVREAFKHVRNPAIMGYEYPEELTTHSGHLKSESRYEGNSHVYQERWKKMDAAFSELEELNLEALVEWGSEHQDKIVPLRRCRGELLMAIQDMLHRYKHPEEGNWKNKEEQANERSILYHLGDDSKHDKFTPEINSAIKLFEDWLRVYISRKK
ncbi:hypothetical protein QPB21_004659 [Vibrio alginolyticus]|uniref:hypothetical protein n=1 Tax=Vibrio TaxID=662 RepID=UPI001A2DA39E|nr:MULTISPECIES: hypothetical protein [Vibrio]EGQ7764567.1 hypothetical protein [Vibrio alginolyticus]EGR0027285.1 hypothetical protein [Vibrio alginolyticus]EGR0722807.1 hypothetical protein [Vibrio alginolyticus]EJE8156013.1 hypothetical protein [Vibrio alginolyticus]EJL6746729.1 hypothetical protein [Vibrio alginolyticus]